ncbi:hypothetical protein [Lignipirellula cremea]|uniref:IgA FC receptor n=1 Tax=Lignipirellula cremea TaxID=2528010 RepID=A0A518DQW9_9BACT|nr:hypothetical protein [Lignipirellula cremea]QDU94235.1 hypothetical protein Pla8534_20230 [Lignipirellula cremea]
MKIAAPLAFLGLALAAGSAFAQVATRYSESSDLRGGLTVVEPYRPALPVVLSTAARYYTPGVTQPAESDSSTPASPVTITTFSVRSAMEASPTYVSDADTAPSLAPMQTFSSSASPPIVPVSFSQPVYPVQPVQFEQPRTAVSPVPPQQFAPQGAGDVTITPLSTTIVSSQSAGAGSSGVPYHQVSQQVGGQCCTPSLGPTAAYLPPQQPGLMPGGACCEPGYGVAAVPPPNAYKPLIALRPYPCEAYVGQGLLGQPKAYMPSQPIRNFFRYILP